jgi:tRNA1(Val) A37 N6-methylase TrmN6
LEEFKEVLLPYKGKKILQDAASQGVSRAAELLHKAVIAEYGDTPLKALELGCGCGIVSIMCALARPAWQISAVEIQAHLADLAQQNAIRCELELDIQCADFREVTGKYDLLYANPPWRKLNSGLMSPSEARNISRFELSCTMDDVLRAIHRLLRQSGKAVLIYPAERWQELQKTADKTLLDIKKHQFHGGNKAYILAIIAHRDNI